MNVNCGQGKPGLKGDSLMRKGSLISGFFILFFVFLVLIYPGPATRSGDSLDYCALLVSWSEYFSPYLTEETCVRIEQRLGNKSEGRRPGFFAWKKQRFPQLLRKGTELDLTHFWFYSLSAAVFYWPAKLVSQNIRLSFMLFHIALLLLAFLIIRRKLGQTAALSLFFLVFASPLFWFINKVQVEFFTVMLAVIGITLLVSEDFAASALSFALASTQNPPFAILCLIAFLLGFWRKKWAIMKRPGAFVWLAALLLAALHPAYYYFRLGILNPIMGGGWTNFGRDGFHVRKMLSFIIDPDIGLLSNWPLALPLILLFAWLTLKKRTRLTPRVGLFVLLSMPILLWSQSRTGNLNHGGTFSISRYALWYLYVFFLIAWQLGEYFSLRKGVAKRVISGTVVGLALVGAVEFWPQRPQMTRRPTWASRFLYCHLPGLYDPMPEIFIERYMGEIGTPAKNIWAISNPSGNKILVLGVRLSRRKIRRDLPLIETCPALNPILVYERARKKAAQEGGKPYFYINGLAKQFSRTGIRSASGY
jgi:hypothetical protein